MKSRSRPTRVVLVAFAIGALPGLACSESAPSSSTTPPSASATSCDPSVATDIEVSGADRDGFPPYALGACVLAYVNRGGDLVARDLGSGVEMTLAPASEHPRRPAVSADVVAWEADIDGHSAVRARWHGVVSTVPGAFASAGEPRVSGSSIVFTAWNGPGENDDTDIWIHEAETGESRLILGGAGQQRFADVSARYVAATDFSEDPDGTLNGNETDIADIVVLDRASGAVTTRRRPGKQAFPILGDGDVLVYLDWASIHPEPKLGAYDLRVAGSVLADPQADRTVTSVGNIKPYTRPALAGGILEWSANPQLGEGDTLWRAPVDGSSDPTAVRVEGAVRLYAPAPTTSGTGRGFTVLAMVRSDAPQGLPRLRALTR